MGESNRPVRKTLADLGLVLAGAVVLILYSSYGRPIWIDENLHFAMGQMDVGYVLKTIHNTTTEINHGQTGVYMFTDWILLRVLGANSVALRLPSLVAGGALLFCAVMFFRVRNFSYAWQYLILVVLAGQSFLMYFVGEARPYMFLAATAVATLAYYQYSPASRQSLVPRLIGIFGVCVGALMHAYFPLMLALILLFSIWTAVRAGFVQRNARSFFTFINLPLLFAGSILFLAVGAFTWLRGTPEFGYDPFASLGSPQRAVQSLIRDHFSTIWDWSSTGIALVLVVVFSISLARFRGIGRLAAPLVLLLLAILSSLVVSLASYLRDYWIMERQWVAGIALGSVALVWFFAELYKAGSRTDSWALRVPAFVFAALTLVSCYGAVQTQISMLQGYREATMVLESDTRTLDQLITERSEWPYIANINIVRGGQVWPIFTEWYGRQAGMREN